MGILGQLGQFCFLSLDFFLLPLIFDTDLVEGFLSLAVTGTVDGELGGNPFALALAIYLEVSDQTFQHRNSSSLAKSSRVRRIKLPSASVYHIVLAYMPGAKQEYSSYDPMETLYPEGLESVHPRFAISWRNKWMIHESDVVVAYIDHSWGGAAQFAELAERKKKRVINIASMMDTKTEK